MKQRGFTFLEILIVLCIVAVIAGVIWAEVESNNRWLEYSQENGCEPVEYKPSQLSTVTTVVNGKVHVGTETTQDMTRWQCNNGQSFWRNGYARKVGGPAPAESNNTGPEG